MPDYRRIIEERERQTLSPYAALSAETRGREYPIDPCPVRTEFVRDRDRIIHCKSFRRLKHKTQVFLSPVGDHYRTRLTHTLEVAQIARTIARGLLLNEDLTEAIAMGHDLGHTPFGHSGESVLNRIVPGGFEHNKQSLRIVEKLENGGYNVSFSITDGSMTLMSFTVFMPDYSQVNLIKRSFYNDPQYIYTVLLAALTENREMIKDSLDKLIAK